MSLIINTIFSTFDLTVLHNSFAITNEATEEEGLFISLGRRGVGYTISWDPCGVAQNKFPHLAGFEMKNKRWMIKTKR